VVLRNMNYRDKSMQHKKAIVLVSTKDTHIGRGQGDLSI
jgi:hypothetical protein